MSLRSSGSQGPHGVSCVAENPTSPRLFPLSLGSADNAGNVVIGCLVYSFFPSQPLNVTWSQSGQSTSVRNFPPVQTTPGGLYTMASQLTLPASQCSAGTTKTCQVQHLSSSSTSVAVPCKGQRAGGGGGPHVPMVEPRPSLGLPLGKSGLQLSTQRVGRRGRGWSLREGGGG